MALSVEVGFFNRGTGTQAVDLVASTRPKALYIFSGLSQTANTNQTTNNPGITIAAERGGTVQQFTLSRGEAHNTATPQAATRVFAGVGQGGSGGAAYNEGVISFTSTGFSIVWSDTGIITPSIVYLALWGTDIVDCDVLTIDSRSTSGTEDHNFGFVPDFVLGLCAGGSISSLPGFDAARGTHAIGLYDGTDQVGQCSDTKDGAGSGDNSETAKVFSSSAFFILTQGSTSAPSVTSKATISKQSIALGDSVDGVRINWSAITGALRYGLLAIKGPRAKVGSGAKPTGASTQTFTAGWQPKALGVLSIFSPTTETPEVGNFWSGMVTDGTTELGAAISGSRDALAAAFIGRRFLTADPMLFKVDQSAASTFVGASNGDNPTITSTGGTLDWSTNDGIADHIQWFALADAAPARSLAGNQPNATGALTRTKAALRALAGSQPNATGTLARIKQALRSLTGAQPNATGALTYSRGYLRSLAGAQPAAAGTLTRIKQALRALAGSQPGSTGALTRVKQALRALAGDQSTATGILTRVKQALRALAGNQPASTGALAAAITRLRSLAGSQPAASGSLTRIYQALRSLAGDQPTATGVLTRLIQVTRSLTGSQPTATGVLTAVKELVERALAGAQPAASGTLSRILQASRALAGNQPAPAGSLARIFQTTRVLAGSQPASSGALARIKQALRALAGNQPTSTGVLSRVKQALRALTGSQPAETGSLARKLQALRALAGSQPAATGVLARLKSALRALAGSQPASSAVLTSLRLVLLAGNQPAATGILTTDAPVSVAITPPSVLVSIQTYGQHSYPQEPDGS